MKDQNSQSNASSPSASESDRETDELQTPAQPQQAHDGDEPVSPDQLESITIEDVRQLIESMRKLQSERDEYLDRSLRTQAEFDNYRKRQQKEFEQERLYAVMPLVRLLLPGLDNLARAIAAAESAGDSSQMIEGIGLVLREFETALEKSGVKPIAAVGEHFDPHLHEALQQIPSADHEPWIIIQELERGYTMHDRVVRPSRVIVSSGPP